MKISAKLAQQIKKDWKNIPLKDVPFLTDLQRKSIRKHWGLTENAKVHNIQYTALSDIPKIGERTAGQIEAFIATCEAISRKKEEI